MLRVGLLGGLLFTSCRDYYRSEYNHGEESRRPNAGQFSTLSGHFIYPPETTTYGEYYTTIVLTVEAKVRKFFGLVGEYNKYRILSVCTFADDVISNVSKKADDST